jgi:tetratricopeptide (TPR) repeat protein
VPAKRIKGAVAALRKKLGDIKNPLKQLTLFCEGRNVAVLVDGQKMEPSGQLLLDFDAEELNRLLSFPRERDTAGERRREAEVWFQRGLDLEQTGAPVSEILRAYERALELEPALAGALVNLGTIRYHLRDWAKAEDCYRKALESDPSYALAHFNLGNLFDERGKFHEALSHYEAAIKLNPSYADAHYNLALLCQSHGELMKAVQHWKTYLKLDPGTSWASIARRELDKLMKAAVVPGFSRQDTTG